MFKKAAVRPIPAPIGPAAVVPRDSPSGPIRSVSFHQCSGLRDRGGRFGRTCLWPGPGASLNLLRCLVQGPKNKDPPVEPDDRIPTSQGMDGDQWGRRLAKNAIRTDVPDALHRQSADFKNGEQGWGIFSGSDLPAGLLVPRIGMQRTMKNRHLNA